MQAKMTAYHSTTQHGMEQCRADITKERQLTYGWATLHAPCSQLLLLLLLLCKLSHEQH
jgi:hypothetical protein